MNSKNKKLFYRRFDIQVCELLQVLAEATIWKVFWKNILEILEHNKLIFLKNMYEKVHF